MLSLKLYKIESGQAVVVVRTAFPVVEERQMKMSCTAESFKNSLGEYKQGKLIQNAFPQLSKEEREFLLTGMYPEEQREFFVEEDEDG